MPVFYLLHNLFNELGVNEKDDDIEHGKRNCKLFLLGVFIYVCIYTFLMHLKVMYPNWLMNDVYRSGLVYLFVADIFVMAYIYKSYFGRSIIHEIGEENELEFEYDKDNHRYIRSKNKKLIEKSLEIIKNEGKSTDLYTGKTCTICLEDFDLDNDKLVALKCGHVYHVDCISELREKVCPLCKETFDL